jgi:HEAT repeat protein
MGIFRKSGSDIHQCIEEGDAGGLCVFLVGGTDEEKKLAANAFLRMAMEDPQRAVEGILAINETRMNGLADTLIDTAGPFHGAVLVLAGHGTDGFRKSLVRSIKKRSDLPYEDLTDAVHSKRNPAARGALSLLMTMGRNAAPYVASLLPELKGDDRYSAACYLRDLGWTPKNPADIARFFYLCNDWEGIAKQGPDALPLLRNLSLSDDAGVRCRAIRTLGKIGDPREIHTLKSALSDTDETVRNAAVDALGKYGLEYTGNILQEALAHPDSQVRLNAAWALHHLGWVPRTEQENLRYLIARMEWEKVAGYGVDAIHECSRMIQTRDAEAEGAVRALTMMGEPGIRALESVTAMLSTPEKVSAKDTAQETMEDMKKRREREELRRRAQIDEQEKRIRDTEAQRRKGSEEDPGKAEIYQSEILVLKGFRRLRAKKTAEKKISEVSEGKEKPEMVPFEYAVLALESNDPAIRASAVDVLSIMGTRAYPYIMRAAEDQSPLVRTASAEAMGFLGSSTILKPLLMLAKDTCTEVRGAAVTSLGSLQDPRAINAVLRLFGDGDADVRHAASMTAARLGKAAYPHLLEVLNDENPHAKISAVQALGELSVSGTVPFLINHLYDSNCDVRDAVSHALALHGGRAVPALTEFAENAVGDPREAAIAALFEIDPEFAAPFLSSFAEGTMKDALDLGRRGAAAFDAIAGDESGRLRISCENGGDSSSEVWMKTGKATGVHLPGNTNDDPLVDILVRIEQGDQELSQELLVQMYDSESPFLATIMDSFGGNDRNQAYLAANLVDSLGWSPGNAREMFLYSMGKGNIDKVHEGGDEVISYALALIENLEAEMQNRLINEICRIGGDAACEGLTTLLCSPDPVVRGAAAAALVQMGSCALSSLRKAESCADEKSTGSIRAVIRAIEK